VKTLPNPVCQPLEKGMGRYIVVVAASVVLLLAGAPVARATTGPDESKLKPATIDVLHYVMATYPEVPEIGGWRPDRIPDHPSGRALDIMAFGNRALGDRIAADLRSRQAELGIRYILWWTKDHYDHLHVCVH